MVSQIIGLNKKANPHPFDFPLIYFWNAGCADIEIIKITVTVFKSQNGIFYLMFGNVVFIFTFF